MHILFVCTGNICRSPTAERLTLAYAATRLPDPAQLSAESAGIRAVYGSPMHPLAELVLTGLGGDARNFEARQLDPEQVAAADVILTMTREQRRTVLNTSPRALSRTFTLREARSLIELVPRSALAPAADLTGRGRDLIAEMVRQRASRHATRRLDDIRDPIGADPETFLKVGDQIATSLIGWLDAFCGLESELVE